MHSRAENPCDYYQMNATENPFLSDFIRGIERRRKRDKLHKQFQSGTVKKEKSPFDSNDNQLSRNRRRVIPENKFWKFSFEDPPTVQRPIDPCIAPAGVQRVHARTNRREHDAS